MLGERMSNGSGVWRRVGRWDLRVWIAEFFFSFFVRIVEWREEGSRGGEEGNKYFGRGLCYVRMGVYGLLMMMMMIERVVVRGLVCLRQSRRVDGGGGPGTCGALM